MNPLIQALQHPEAYPHVTENIHIAETHISWVILTGKFAYKIKKTVDLGFLDFSTLQKRQHFCHEELRLNRRLCPDLYLAVVPITRSGETISLDGDGEIVEYAVKMIQFDRSQELDRLLATNNLTKEHINTIALLVADFHLNSAQPVQDPEAGHPENLIKPVLDNFSHLLPDDENHMEAVLYAEIEAWIKKEHSKLYQVFAERQKKGFIRHCHGDMHTGNMVLWRNEVSIFDCIEFNQNLFRIDVISDIAFLFMDLDHAGRADLAWQFLNSYLMVTGDYQGIKVLAFYAVYRAMVRAKVTAIRYSQECEKESKAATIKEHQSYLALAKRYMTISKPLLVLASGVSGSGKTTHSAILASTMHALHVRSDIERKRLFGLSALEKSSERAGRNIYTPQTSRKTYQKLLDIAALAIDAEVTVFVDATFLYAKDREMFQDLAETKKCPVRIILFQASKELLAERVRLRSMLCNDASEADEKVLSGQMKSQEALLPEEERFALTVNTSGAVDHEKIITALCSINK
ncbi:MAG: AAA family ATPase [Chlorobiaceae bacterium]|nr:AAA family ATPase [Chlorobiaceae bacterium]